MKPGPRIRPFRSERAWRAWLVRNHADPQGVWLRFFKKDSGISSVDHDQALDEALCFGWIDGQLKKGDEKSWLQRFTPRRPKSIWSKKNTIHASRLIKAGKMAPPGLAEVEAAKADGRWEHAYDSPRVMKVPADFIRALSKNHSARTFFESLNKANHYAIAWRLQTAKKPETRARRMQELLAKMANGEKIH